jgi:hypothetical protein
VAAYDGELSPDQCKLELAMLLSRAAHEAGQDNGVQVHRGRHRGIPMCGYICGIHAYVCMSGILGQLYDATSSMCACRIAALQYIQACMEE